MDGRNYPKKQDGENTNYALRGLGSFPAEITLEGHPIVLSRNFSGKAI